MKDIQLIKLSEDYLEMILEWRNSPEVRNNMYTNDCISLGDHLKWYSSIKEDTSKIYFIFMFNQKPCGVVAFTGLNDVIGISSWAFYTAPKVPRGTGSLMEYIALEHAFNTLKLKKLRCEVLGFNKTVVKLHKKFGFKVEGKLRSAFHDGEEYQDVIHLGIFPKEWKDMKESIKKKLKL